MYVAIKPASLLLSTALIDKNFSNMMAMSIAISGSLMASLSFGSYKKIFRKGKSTRYLEYYSNMRRSLFGLNFIIILLIGILVSLILKNTVILFICMFVILEHIIHDEARIHLYSGDRVKWAQQNCLRTLFIPIIPCLMVLLDGINNNLIYIMLFLLVINIIYSNYRNDLLGFNSKSCFNLLRRKFYLYYFSNMNYFISGSVNRVMQQSDRFIFSLISYEIFWIYAILTQIMNIPLMFFELTYMSNMKSKIAKISNYRFKLINQKQIKNILVISFFSSILYFLTGYFIKELLTYNFLVMAFIIVMANFVSATSMINSEYLFWSVDNPSLFRRIEFSSFLIGHVLSVPILIFTGNNILSKLPNILSITLKIRHCKRILKVTD